MVSYEFLVFIYECSNHSNIIYKNCLLILLEFYAYMHKNIKILFYLDNLKKLIAISIYI